MSGIKPPFTAETALQKVKAAQRLWNTRDPKKVSLAYTVSIAPGLVAIASARSVGCLARGGCAVP